MLLIGSAAIRHHFPDFNREPFDHDYVVERATYKSATVDGVRTEYHEIPSMWIRYEPSGVVSVDHLYTLKMSHIFWPIKQEKHLYDIHFLKSKGAKLDDVLFRELHAHWTLKYGPNTSLDLDVSNADFFNDNVDRVIQHDNLHLMVNPEPLYMLAKDSPDNASISEEKFFKLHRDVQMDIVREEGYVLALERFVIPSVPLHWRVAYARMIRHMICRLTPQWLGIFIAENYYEIVKPKINYTTTWNKK